MPKALPSKTTAERARAVFLYDPVTGTLINTVTGNQIVGDTIHFGEDRETSRFIWLLYYGEWPPLDKLVDHKDRDRTNWKITNLRLADYSENGYNMARINHSGYKGVY